MKLKFEALALLMTGLVTCQASCEVELENTIATGIKNELDLLMSIPDKALVSAVNAFKFMEFEAPSEINDPDPPVQSTLYASLVTQAEELDYGIYAGFESGGEFVYYMPGATTVGFRASGDYNASEMQLELYNYNPTNGYSTGNATAAIAYDPRIRVWYEDAKDACSMDDLGVYTCKMVWSDFYVFAGFDGDVIGISPALGFTDSTGTSFEGVAACDYTTDFISDMLKDVTPKDGSTISYIMDRNGSMVAASNDVKLTANNEQIKAVDCDDEAIARSADYLLTNHYRSDQTLIVDDSIYTIQNFLSGGLHWYIVVVEDFTASSDCNIKLEEATLDIAKAEVDALLAMTEELALLLERSIAFSVVPSSASPDTFDDNNGIQDLMYGFGIAYSIVRSFGIGWEDGTYLGYGGQEDITGYKYLNFRPRGDSSTVRNSYYIDPDTGKTSSASYASDVFDPRLQSWYGAAKTAISGAFSSIYTLDDGRLAISFNMPVYEGSTFISAIYVEFEFSSIDDILAATFGGSGSGMYAMETSDTSASDAFDMISTSAEARVINSEMKQNKAYSVEDVEDYYISRSAQYMMDNNFLSAGYFAIENMAVTVARYDSRGLHWHMVSYDIVYSDDVATASSDNDDDLETVKMLSTATMAIVCILLVAVVVVLVHSLSNKRAPPGGSSIKETTMSPMGKSEA